ncbi:anthranilate phosphoribosyltransferase [Persicobacter psychrovividus]|uniref:Anthranilate phosphoribosyltransferase n=1 Tax=Persicobacter psychrovividus TaxID=387638 RepID=A0ABM7VDR8_9BACT|nr:anthranilate phosphoribosyltransferase [Persicobacter psychrovividus]
MKSILNKLFDHQALDQETAKHILTQIAKGDINTSQMAAFMTVYLMRPITVEELAGFRDAMLEMCNAVNLSAYNPVDIVGTGGDGKNTFNISTLSSFIVAGAGQPVAKHGNNSVSSVSGSSNVLVQAGVKFTNEQDKLEELLDKAGICFLHAPLFHPAMANVAPVRKELGVRTFFNILGPLTNPSMPKNMVNGVYNLGLARLYGYLYQNSGKNFTILHALDGYDEISLTGAVKLINNKGEHTLSAQDLGFDQHPEAALYGGNSVEDAATIFMNILEGRSTAAQSQVVIANAGVSIQCAQPELSLEEAMAKAKESLESGAALRSFKTFVELSQKF